MSLTELFDLSTFHHRELFSGCEHPWEPLLRLKDYLNNVPGNIATIALPEGVYVRHPETIYVGAGTVFEPGCYLEGPCILGEGCKVRHGAYLRGYVLAGKGCVLGHATEAKHAIFLDGAHAAHFAYVGDSIVGNRVNLGAGVKCANLKFDGSSISVMWKGFRLHSGLKKLGAIIGDNSQIGCNAVTNPGTVIGAGVFWYPCINKGGEIPSGSIVR